MKNNTFKLTIFSISIILLLFLIVPILKMFTHSTLDIFYQSAKEKEVIDSILLT
jgi:ABC-type sulfate transport system permease component